MPEEIPQVALRPPHQVMRLARLGSFHQTRLSFMRVLLREVKRDGWEFKRREWQIDGGEGYAIYEARRGARVYSLICFAQQLPDELRSDRVIAEAWDATFVLYDGEPNGDEIKRLARNVPHQEAGKYRQSELVLARANRSSRLFDYVVDELSRGAQPTAERIAASGYLMRTTAVYGNGKFGISDRAAFAGRSELQAPFRAELLSVWLIRWFTIDLVEHLARAKNSNAARLKPELARQLGVGNATGLGMAPFLLHHPVLIHHWMHARETALARVRAVKYVSPDIKNKFINLVARAEVGLDDWHTTDHGYQKRIKKLRADINKIKKRVGGELENQYAWDNLFNWAQRNLTLEGQEFLLSLMLEPYGELIDGLSDVMGCDEKYFGAIAGGGTLAQLREAIARDYAWATDINYDSKKECARFWYVSAEKLEPRLGLRFEEPGADKELSLAFARDICALEKDARVATAATVAEFLCAHPHHRHAVRRVQLGARFPYCEIRDNLISADLFAVDLLRCKLSFFGANRFDPKSDRWVRITMYQHAPHPYELADYAADDWHYPQIQ